LAGTQAQKPLLKNLQDPTATYNVRVTVQQTGQTTLATIGLKK
jgi:hypothetical protein